jgi:CheY-like chemotaxis protein
MPGETHQALIVDDSQEDITLLQDALKEIQVPHVDATKTLVPAAADSLEVLQRRFRDALSAPRGQCKPQLVFLDILFERPDGSEPAWGRNLAQHVREFAPDVAVLLYTRLPAADEKLVSLRCESLFDGFLYKSDLYTGEATLRRGDKTLLGTVIEEALKAARHRRPQAIGGPANLRRIVEGFRPLVALANSSFGVQLPDEPATQKFLHILLLAVFRNVTREDPLSARGAKSTRADFVIPDIETLVELKYISQQGDIKRIQEEISADVPQYKNREGISTIAFLIYDPSDLCHDKDSVQQFLESQDSTVVVYFV